MIKASDMLLSALGSPEILRAARAHGVLNRWNEAVGEILAERSEIVKFDHGTLVVGAYGSAWAQEIRLREHQILERMNSMAGEKLFLALRVQQSQAPLQP